MFCDKTAALNASLADVQRLTEEINSAGREEINSDDRAKLEQELEDTKKASKALKSLEKRPNELVSFHFRFHFRFRFCFCFDLK